ncbi:fumarylacetoacetate hydrolase family protein [Micromonospora costi]|uniref:FAA hydrolase family protein n=1 Tax=Micromonospora costi TaxID=1530042 RepID=A0A3B0A4E5_9ACTN|nr:fumarylacetoacetate hydrolase family protein [Micromonospora costi]RKN55284.1 FAA hydrolase family protein [Micromonospora costi]
MRLATIRTATGTRAARVETNVAIPLGYPDVGALLAAADVQDINRIPPAGKPVPVEDADFAPVLTSPSKVICVGLNYRTHILEMGRELPEHPTLFAKFADTLIGARDDVVLPITSAEVDWEAELGVIIGTSLRRATREQAHAAIAGYTVVNDVSMRDWQWRTTQWLQGKAFERTTPVGPFLVTPDEVDHARDLEVRCEVDGSVMQHSRTSDLLFDPAATVAYISQFTTLRPGDLIATGTPGGVGAARDPKVFLAPGQTLLTVIEGLGECVNVCREEKE